MDFLKHLLGDGWKITPAGGVTGEAYYAQRDEEKLFLKRNSSPFLAVLSAEGIVPKLLWTRRLESGDVITAQRWVDGRELKSYEMKEQKVAKLLGKIHRSKDLLEMFKRIGNKPLTPESIVEDISNSVKENYLNQAVLRDAIEYLKKHIQDVADPNFVVCHADVNHNNWVLSSKGDLYLIDWDGALVADPALDIGILLYLYIPQTNWVEWLDHYGIMLDDQLSKRMHWYVVAQSIFSVLWHYRRLEMKEVEHWLTYLDKLLKQKTDF